MEVTYIDLLLQLLNNEENLNLSDYHDDIIVNLYVTLLSLSNQDFKDDNDSFEEETIRNFQAKLNNLKVKIQLKRKPQEINTLANKIINLYYENINILQIYIKDGIELENIINSLDAKSLTSLIDKITKHRMNKTDRKEENNQKREKLSSLIKKTEYQIEDSIIYIEDLEVSIQEFNEIYNYLLNVDNYAKTYNQKKAHDIIITIIIRMLLSKEIKQEELMKVIIPMTLTYLLSRNTDYQYVNTSNFNIENMKISDLYSLTPNQGEEPNGNHVIKWGKEIPNEYLFEKIKDLVSHGMYYQEEENFILDKSNDFKVSISLEQLKELLAELLLNNQKNIKAK